MPFTSGNIEVEDDEVWEEPAAALEAFGAVAGCRDRIATFGQRCDDHVSDRAVISTTSTLRTVIRT